MKGYFPCHNQDEVVEAIGYDPERDVENPTGSVFCAHGAGYNVPWQEVPEHMHIEAQLPKILEERKRLAGETEKAGAGDVENGVQEIWCEFCTDAYIAGRYREFLQERGLFEAVVEAVLTEGLAVESAPKVEAFLQQMITRTEAYFYYYDATQPILIYLGDSCCYNILNILANELAKALYAKGNAIRFYDVAAEDVQGLPRLLGELSLIHI